MMNLKKWKLIGSYCILFTISGCSMFGGVYDTNEYASFTNLAFLADQTRQSCGQKEKVEYLVLQMKHASQYAVLFTKHQPNNNELHKISKELNSLTEELYQASLKSMSETYCNVKTQTIQEMAEVAMKASSSKRR